MIKASKSYEKELLKALKNPDEAAAYLNAAIEEGSNEIFLLALRNVAEAHGFTNLSKQTQLNRESMYRMLSEKGNPQLSSLLTILKSIGLRFVFEVDKETVSSVSQPK
jgi:probable addiction module antidote protein